MFDFSNGWTQALNDKLQGVLSMDVTGATIVSPVLNDDVAFDLALQRPGDIQTATYTVTLLRADTLAFTHIDELANYINGRIATVVNGALQLQDQLPAWVSEGGQASSGTDSAAATGTAATIDVTQVGGQAVNAVVLIDVGTATGTLNLFMGTRSQGVSIAANDTDEAIAANIAQAVAALAQVPTAAITVSGNRGDGFRVEFGGAASGKAHTAPTLTEGLLTANAGKTAFTAQVGPRSGDLTLVYGATSATASIGETDTAAQIITKLTAAATTAFGVAPTSVIGNRVDGFVITFGSAKTSAASAAMLVQDNLTLRSTMTVPANAKSAVTQSVAATAGVSEVKMLTLIGYDRGEFQLQLLGQRTEAIRYVAGPYVQSQLIQKALEAIVGTGNVEVTFPQKDPRDPDFVLGGANVGVDTNLGSAPTFLITFKGTMADRNVPDMTIYYGGLKAGSYVPAGETRGVSLVEYRPGTDKAGEVQTVVVTAAADTPATFNLQFTHDGKTYTTAALTSSASAAQVRTALLAATSGSSVLSTTIAGVDLSVTSSERGVWKVKFGGALAGSNVNELVVSNLLNAITPTVTVSQVQSAAIKSEVQSLTLAASSGEFALQLGESGAFSSTFSAATSAKDLQAILEAMPDIGKGNVKVSGEPQKWVVSFTGRLSGQNVDALRISTIQVLPLTVAASGQTTFQVQFAGDAAYGVAVDVTGKTKAQVAQSLQAAIAALDGVGADQVEVRVRAVAEGQAPQYEVLFKGICRGRPPRHCPSRWAIPSCVRKLWWPA